MFYTLSDPKVRQNTTKEVVTSNIMSSLALFENMGFLWPNVSKRCREVIQRLGKTAIRLFDDVASPSSASNQHPDSTEHPIGHFNSEYMDLFGTQEISRPTPSSTELFDTITPAKVIQSVHYIDEDFGRMTELDGLDDFQGLFQFGFDMTLPLMTNALNVSTFNDTSVEPQSWAIHDAGGPHPSSSFFGADYMPTET